MNFGKFDMVLLTTMALAVVLMSFTFPAMGMADSSNETAADDIPEFDVNSTEWDIAGEFPSEPGTPSSGTIQYDEEQGSGITGLSLIWIDRPKSDGTSLEVQNDTLSNGNVDVVVTDFNSSAASGRDAQDRYTLNGNEGQTFIHENTTWTIEFTVDRVENFKESNMTVDVKWNILESEDENGGVAAIPVIGTLYNAGQQLAAMLAYLGDIILWFLATLLDLALTVIGILLNIITYAVDMSSWLITSYFDIVTAAESYAAVIVVVPGVLLFVEFAKLAMIGVSLLPMT